MRYLTEWTRERILPDVRYLVLTNRSGNANRMPVRLGSDIANRGEMPDVMSGY